MTRPLLRGGLARLRLRPTRHTRRPFLARASRALPTRRSLVPPRRKPLSETWLNCEDPGRSRNLVDPRCNPTRHGDLFAGSGCVNPPHATRRRNLGARRPGCMMVGRDGPDARPERGAGLSAMMSGRVSRTSTRGLRRGSRSAKIARFGCLPGLGGVLRRIELFAIAAPTRIGHPARSGGSAGSAG